MAHNAGLLVFNAALENLVREDIFFRLTLGLRLSGLLGLDDGDDNRSRRSRSARALHAGGGSSVLRVAGTRDSRVGGARSTNGTLLIRSVGAGNVGVFDLELLLVDGELDRRTREWQFTVSF